MNAHLPARRLHALRLSTIAFLLQQLWIPAHAAPDQTPLVNRPEGKPLPNLMLTLDESGSMTQGYLPEGKFTVGTFKNLSFGIQGPRYLFAHPKELEKNRFTGWQQKWADSIFMTSVPLESQDQLIVNKSQRDLVLQYQSRSPQVNQIYYNPAIKYKPWTTITKDGVLKSFYNADPKDAHLDPLAYDPDVYDANFKVLDQTYAKYPSGWVDTKSSVDLTKDLVNPDGTPGYMAKWHSLINRDKNGEPSVTTRTYSPALVYLLSPGLDPGETKSYTYFNLNADVAKVKYPEAYPDRTDCEVNNSNRTTACDKSTELQNYANWFVFYRSRLFIAQGALPDALLPLGNQFRMGWGGLHPGVKRDSSGLPSDDYNNKGTNMVDGTASSTIHQGVRDWTKDQKYALTKWIRVLKTYGGTPTRQATQSVTNYFMRTDKLSPWSSDMVKGTALSSQLRCRRAYNVVLTDGYYNEPDGITLTSNVDGDSGLGYPFQDDSTKTLADYAMNAWQTDLQNDKATAGSDRVKPIIVTPTGTSADDALLASIKSDPATYRHLTQFYMGFGLTGNLLTNDVLSDPSAYNKALLSLAYCGKTGGACWSTFDPDSSRASTADIIDDIWHAAINSRGQFFNISNPKSVKESIDAIVNRSSSESFKEGGLATASSSLIAGNVKFVPEYIAYTWTGTVKAYALNESGKITSELWNAENTEGTPTMPPPANRNIYVGNSTGAVALNESGLGADMIDFLRGAQGSGALRQHDPKHQLPDFINSTPLFVKAGVNLGLADESYLQYRAGKRTRTNGLLFVGGNGGMLHAFNAATGQELFAYVPTEANVKFNGSSKLDKIASLDYGYPNNYHEYVVDGQLTESDVHIGTHWENIVVGTMGAGGKSIFAIKLDTVDPTSSLNATSIKWDVTSGDVGYITSTPQIGQLANGKSRIFVGNGVDSVKGVPALLSIDPADGSISAIQLPTAIDGTVSPPTGSAHGLGGVTLVKDSKTGFVTTIYAGDTLGRMWRFDVTANGDISIGYNSNPIFTTSDKDEAGTSQPILAAPLVYSHPRGGQVVVFNTGKLLYEADNNSQQRQAAYGIWDKIATNKSSTSETAPSITRANLLHQYIDTRNVITQAFSNTAAFFTLKSEDLTKEQEATKLGWVLDLAVPETSGVVLPKAIYDPQSFGSAVLISSVAPGSKEESCTAAGAKGYGFLIDGVTGKSYKLAVLDTNGDGLVNNLDAVVSGFTYGGGSQRILTKTNDNEGGPTPPPPPCGGTPADVVGSIQSATGDLSIKTPGTASECASYTVKDRIWRQLFNPPHP